MGEVVRFIPRSELERARLIREARVLAALDLSLGHVLRVRVFLTHFKRDYEAMNEVYADFFPSHARPARTCVGVTDLVRDALIEIDCVAKR